MRHSYFEYYSVLKPFIPHEGIKHQCELNQEENSKEGISEKQQEKHWVECPLRLDHPLDSFTRIHVSLWIYTFEWSGELLACNTLHTKLLLCCDFFDHE